MQVYVREIVQAIEDFAPASLQESWDNSGLLLGNLNDKVHSAVITLDVTEAVIDDAISHGDDMIIAHHPIIFRGLKRINGKNDVERTIIKAIKHNIAIYAAHTNIDVVEHGVSWRMAHKLGLENICTLSEQKGLLKKLVVFVPEKAVETLRKALFDAGAGEIGNYSSCSFNTQGQGSFKAGNNTNPYVGKPGELHFENEVRIETIFPAYLQYAVVSAMLKVHPYEEPAYDIYSLENTHHKTGLGVIGNLPRAVDSKLFLQKVKKAFACKVIRHTAIHKPKIEKVALLGGSGSSYLHEAIAAGADIFITADVKYHEFFEAGNKIIFADIGHFESEQFTKELFYEIVTNKFSKFAVRLSEVTTNPMNYLI